MIEYKHKRINMFIMRILLLFLFIIQGVESAESCLDKSYRAAKVKKSDRDDDLNYSSCVAQGTLCCCTNNIIGLIKEYTKKITQDRVNPAVDKLIEALENQRKASDIKIEELVHLKYVNAIYSFYDKNDTKMKKEKLTMPDDDEDGCQDTITFRKLKPKDLEREGVYREGILKEMLNILHSLKKSEKMIENKNMIKMVK